MMLLIILQVDACHIKGIAELIGLIIKKAAMKELNISDVPTGTYEIAMWLIMLLTMLFGYKYIKEIIEYVLLKLYEYFIQHKF
jgi:hypothetical protein